MLRICCCLVSLFAIFLTSAQGEGLDGVVSTTTSRTFQQLVAPLRPSPYVLCPNARGMEAFIRGETHRQKQTQTDMLRAVACYIIAAMETGRIDQFNNLGVAATNLAEEIAVSDNTSADNDASDGSQYPLGDIGIVSFRAACDIDISGLSPSDGRPCAFLSKVLTDRKDEDAAHTALVACIEQGFTRARAGMHATDPNTGAVVEFATRELFPIECYFALGTLYLRMGQPSMALRVLKTASHVWPESAKVAHNYAVALRNVGLHRASMVVEARAFRLDPSGVQTNLALLQEAVKRGQPQEIATYIKHAMTAAPDSAEVALACADAVLTGGLLETALGWYNQAIRLHGDEVIKSRCRLAAVAADHGLWEIMHRELDIVMEKLPSIPEQLLTCMQPLQALLYPVDAMFLRWASQKFVEFTIRDNEENIKILGPLPSTHGDMLANSRQGVSLKVGYISSNLQAGAVHTMIQGLFATHNTNKHQRCDVRSVNVDLFTYGLMETRTGGRNGVYDKSLKELQEYSRYSDISGLPYIDAARQIRGDNLNVLVDINGWTEKSCYDITALRLAHIQVSYMGFPGAVGDVMGRFIDYLVSDRVASPPDLSWQYTEKLIVHPVTYYVNDFARQIRPQPLPPMLSHNATMNTLHDTLHDSHQRIEQRLNAARREHGLPTYPTIVYMSFNRVVKMDPNVFGAWLTILKRVTGSVLWLLKETAVTDKILRQYASDNGVEPSRLIFAPWVDWPTNVRRGMAADVFLDTPAYNAHSTGANAIFAGVPLVTLPGEKMAARVGASLMQAMGSAGCVFVVRDMTEYIQVAVRLGTNRQRLDGFRRAMVGVADTVSKSTSTPITAPSIDSGKILFDTPLLVGELERGLAMAHDIRMSGSKPHHIAIATT